MPEELKIAHLLNDSEYLCLSHISEPRDNSLRLIVEQAIENRAKTGGRKQDVPELDEILKDAWPIETTDTCKAFELYWNTMWLNHIAAIPPGSIFSIT